MRDRLNIVGRCLVLTPCYIIGIPLIMVVSFSLVVPLTYWVVTGNNWMHLIDDIADTGAYYYKHGWSRFYDRYFNPITKY